MKKILFLLLVLTSMSSHAQNDDGPDRLLIKQANWRKSYTINAPVIDASSQKKFLQAVHYMFQPKDNPMGVMLDNSFSPTPQSSEEVLNYKGSDKNKTRNNVVTVVNKTTNNTSNKVIANTSNQPKPPGKTYTVSGTLSGPSGTPATINCNGSDLSVSVPKGNKNFYGTTPFSFAKPVAENAPYKVTVKKFPSNMKAVVYKGSGTAPHGVDQIKIGVDYTYELLTRSSDDKVMSTFYECRDIAIGGYKGEEGRYVAFVSLTPGLEGSN